MTARSGSKKLTIETSCEALLRDIEGWDGGVDQPLLPNVVASALFIAATMRMGNVFITAVEDDLGVGPNAVVRIALGSPWLDEPKVVQAVRRGLEALRRGAIASAAAPDDEYGEVTLSELSEEDRTG